MRKETVETMEQLMPLIRECLAAGGSVRIYPKGVSMLPMLRQGKDSVVLSPVAGPLRKYDIPLYQYPSGKYVLHRIVDVTGGRYICRGDNTYLNEQITQEQVIAVVTAFHRSERKIPTDAPGYRLYCRLWCGLYPTRLFLHRGMNWLRRHLQ